MMMAFENTNKRPAQDILTNNLDQPKKRKVEFSEEITSHPAPEGTNENEGFSMEMYRRFIKSILDDMEKHDSTQFEQIAHQVALPKSNTNRIKTEHFGILLDVLSNNINKIDSRRGAVLVQAIINFEQWWELPPQTLSKYIFFIRILCSSIPKWWQDVSMILISGFHLPLESTVFHHEMLRFFLQMIPSSMGFIDLYIIRFFPNNNDTRKRLINYISNVLQLTTYCKELRFQAWSLLIERTISLDVELQNELDELDDDIDDGLSDSSADENDSEDDQENDDEDNDGNEKSGEHQNGDLSDDEDDEGQEEYNVQASMNIKELSCKLDSILTLISGRLGDSLTPESLENGEGVAIFNTLTTLFKTHILPTYYTRSIQYIMFYISQQQAELMDSFLVTLIDISFSPNETYEKKIKSLQYLGSFIARAKKLSRSQIIFVASYLTSWLNRYVIEREDEVDQSGGMERFKHFYATFQALCYIFCFRYSLFRDTDGSWECELEKFFPRMVLSKFNPLKYCNENVMLMFARISQHEDVAYCFSIIENNNNERLRGIIGRGDKDKKNNALSGTASTWSLATRQQFIDLQSYFPFDPLFLKQFKSMMKEHYIEWSEACGEYESDDPEE